MPWRSNLAAKADVRVVALITHGSVAELLAEPDGAGWRLPSFDLAGVPDSRAIAPVLRAAVAERLGLPVAVLSVLHTERDDPDGRRTTWVALDALAVPKDGTEPAGSSWLALADLARLSFNDEPEAARVRQWLADLASGGGPVLRMPWARPGWLAEATGWIEAQLAAQGLPQAGAIEQQRTWSLSALLRVPLASGSAYFKALPPLFAAEPDITAALARRFPGQIPDVVAANGERGWLLMREFPGELLQHHPDLSVWSAALRQYARLQAATAAEAEAWLAAGCPDRRLAYLPAHFQAVLGDHEHLLIGHANGLTETQHAELLDLAHLIPAACLALEACGFPYTLEHGDLHGNNVAVTPDGLVFFDWSDACWAHPLTCLTTFLETVASNWHTPLTEAYLSEWEAWTAPDRVRRAHSLSQPLGAAHLAVSYHRILATTEPSQRWQLAGALPFFLREVLRYKAALVPL